MGEMLRAVDRVEIMTLQDNYIDLLARDSSTVVQRAIPLVGLEIKNSVLAEHGFSSLVSVSCDNQRRDLMFDFGFSQHGAAFNADALSIDLTGVEVLALSHGHPDHTGGLRELCRRIRKSELELVAHPAAFRASRCQKITEEIRIHFPAFTQMSVREAGAKAMESEKPISLLDGLALFLGEIPRKTDFEKVPPSFYFVEQSVEKPDLIEDDTSLVFHLKGRGLIILSGCAHAGIINTVEHARNVTGVDEIFAVMGGFHLCQSDVDSVIAPTVEALTRMSPTYVIPTHCTGKTASDFIQNKMPNQFLLNMSGTRMVFS
ncbi:MAG: MBL fold metallo-hydrolase [Deltaproteobacteria bacterium]|nr:MBL fold metallo-hydrolase [Deltaproteobacteria bacterium]